MISQSAFSMYIHDHGLIIYFALFYKMYVLTTCYLHFWHTRELIVGNNSHTHTHTHLDAFIWAKKKKNDSRW